MLRSDFANLRASGRLFLPNWLRGVPSLPWQLARILPPQHDQSLYLSLIHI